MIRMNQIVTIKITGKKVNHAKMEHALKSYMEYEHAHPEIYHYSSTRFYTMDSSDNKDEEIWLCIDHFENHEDYLGSLKEAFKSDPESLQHYKEVVSNIVDKDVDVQNVPSRNLWTEVESLRVDNQGH